MASRQQNKAVRPDLGSDNLQNNKVHTDSTEKKDRSETLDYQVYLPVILPDPHRAPSLYQHFIIHKLLVEEAEDLAGDVLAAGLLVVHDTSRGGQDDIAELTGGQELGGPRLESAERDGVAGADDTALVQTEGEVSKYLKASRRQHEPAVELDDDLAGAVVVDLLELANVA
jgi:hypothetical protein